MYQFTNVPGISARQFALAWRHDRTHPLRMHHPKEGEYTLIFDTKSDAIAYLTDVDVPTPIRDDYVVTTVAEISKTPTDKYVTVHVGAPTREPDLFLTCPRCETSGFEEAFEDRPNRIIRCRSCGTDLDATAFHPRLIRRHATKNTASPNAHTVRVVDAPNHALAWRIEPRKGDDVDGLLVLSRDHGFSQLKMTDDTGSTWPAAFRSPIDAAAFVENLRNEAKTKNGSPETYDGYKTVRAASCGLLDERAYVFEMTRAMVTCPTCGRISNECDPTTKKFICPTCSNRDVAT